MTGAQGLFVGLTAAPCVSFLQQGRAVGLDKKFKVIGEAGTELMIAKAMQKSTPNNLWGVTIIGSPEVNAGKVEDKNAADYNPGENVFKNNGNNNAITAS